MMKYFKPLEDITTYELACIYATMPVGRPLAKGIYFPVAAWQAIPENVRRHFSDEYAGANDPQSD
mgnify:CR=1 FL=1